MADRTLTWGERTAPPTAPATGFISQYAVGGELFGIDSAGVITKLSGGIPRGSVADIDDPSAELNTRAGGVGELISVYEAATLADDVFTIYGWDPSPAVAENVPFTVDGAAGGRWISIGGRFQNQVLESSAAANLVRFFFLNFATLPDPSDFHGMFAHVHDPSDEEKGQSAFFAHIPTVGPALFSELRHRLRSRRVVLTGTDINFGNSGDAILSKTLADPTTLTISNPKIDRTIRLEIQSGSGESLTLPSSVKTFGVYDTGAVNHISIYCNDAITPLFFATIFQEGGGAVPLSRALTAGAGLTGGGDLSADRTFDVGAHPDGSIVANPNDLQVGVLATDGQHGARGGGTQHADAVPSGAAGFISGASQQKLEDIETGAQVNTVDSVFGRTGAVAAAISDYDASQVDFSPAGDIAATDAQAAIVEVRDDTDTKLAGKADTTTTITAGAGLTGGGDLSANRTIDVVANADASIVVNADDIQVGVLATDAQHGVRGGGTQHAAAISGGADGFMTGANVEVLDTLDAERARTQEIVQTSSISETALTPQVITSFELTAADAGEYLVLASIMADNDGPNRTNFHVFVNAVEDTPAGPGIREHSHGAFVEVMVPIVILRKLTLAASDVVSIRVSVTGGTGNMEHRILQLLKVI